MSSAEHKNKIWNIISKIKIGMLTTEDGMELRARPMQLVQNSYDGTIWFYTNLDSAKTDEVQEDRHVCLSFSDIDEGVYVSLSGVANITRDKALIEKFWNPFVAAWFPEGKESPSCALLEVKINHGEHWDNEVSKVGYLYEIAKSSISNSKPKVGENQKF